MQATSHDTAGSAKSKRTWLLRAGVLLALCVGCVALMTARIKDFHEHNTREIFAFRRIDEREFTYAGHPVSLIDDRSVPNASILDLRFGGAHERIPATIAPEAGSTRWNLPGLLPHEDWLRVLRMIPAGGQTPERAFERLAAGEVRDRLIIVSRIPPPGADAATWGGVWRKKWSFDFYELNENGTITKHPRLKYPSKSGFRAPKEGDLHENTWQYQAALHTMPSESKIGPPRNFFGNALSAAGWTLPASAFLGLGATAAFVVACSPDRRSQRSQRSWRAEDSAIGS